MCKLINFIRLIAGLLSTITLGVSGYFYINHYDDLDCGDMKLGITLGISSIILFLFNILTYMSSCNKKWIVTLCGLFLLGSMGYNIYLNETIEQQCKQKYKDKNIWQYYVYLYISMIVLSIIFVGLVITSNCFKKKNDGIN